MQSRRDFLVSFNMYLASVICSLNFFVSSYSGLQLNLKLNLIELGVNFLLTIWNFNLPSNCRTSMDIEKRRDANPLVYFATGLRSDSSRLEMGTNIFAIFKLA